MSEQDDDQPSISYATTQSDGPTIFSLPNSIMIFPQGVVKFAEKYNLDVLQIDTDGDMLGHVYGANEWLPLPPATEEDKPAAVVSPFKKRGD
jgi:hypothetical protein